MTPPIIFGVCMTVSFCLIYRLKPRRWRKWSGIGIALLAAVALINLPEKSLGLFLALLTALCSGLRLYKERDLFSEEEA